MRTTAETERAIRLAERLIKLDTSPSLTRHAERIRQRLSAMPMRHIVMKVPGETIVAKARILGVTRQTIYYWLREETRPDPEQAKKLSRLTGINADVIRGRNE